MVSTSRRNMDKAILLASLTLLQLQDEETRYTPSVILSLSGCHKHYSTLSPHGEYYVLTLLQFPLIAMQEPSNNSSVCGNVDAK